MATWIPQGTPRKQFQRGQTRSAQNLRFYTELFGDREATSWTCAGCTQRHQWAFLECPGCQTPRPDLDPLHQHTWKHVKGDITNTPGRLAPNPTSSAPQSCSWAPSVLSTESKVRCQQSLSDSDPEFHGPTRHRPLPVGVPQEHVTDLTMQTTSALDPEARSFTIPNPCSLSPQPEPAAIDAAVLRLDGLVSALEQAEKDQVAAAERERALRDQLRVAQFDLRDSAKKADEAKTAWKEAEHVALMAAGRLLQNAEADPVAQMTAFLVVAGLARLQTVRAFQVENVDFMCLNTLNEQSLRELGLLDEQIYQFQAARDKLNQR